MKTLPPSSHARSKTATFIFPEAKFPGCHRGALAMSRLRRAHRFHLCGVVLFPLWSGAIGGEAEQKTTPAAENHPCSLHERNRRAKARGTKDPRDDRSARKTVLRRQGDVGLGVCDCALSLPRLPAVHSSGAPNLLGQQKNIRPPDRDSAIRRASVSPMLAESSWTSSWEV